MSVMQSTVILSEEGEELLTEEGQLIVFESTPVGLRFTGTYEEAEPRFYGSYVP